MFAKLANTLKSVADFSKPAEPNPNSSSAANTRRAFSSSHLTERLSENGYFPQSLRQARILILKILNVFLRLKSSPSLTLQKISHSRTASQDVNIACVSRGAKKSRCVTTKDNSTSALQRPILFSERFRKFLHRYNSLSAFRRRLSRFSGPAA